MPVKFESITFNTKDVVMIVGAVISAFTFYDKIDSRLYEFELKIQKIDSRTDMNEVRFNAKLDAMKHTSNDVPMAKDNLHVIAWFDNRRLEVTKEKKTKV